MLGDRGFEKQEKLGHDAIDVAKACAREVYVFGAGTIAGAVNEGLDQAGATTLKQFGTSLGLGVGLGILQRGGTLRKLACESIVAGSSLAFATDVMSSPRWEQIKDIAWDTWHNPGNLDSDVAAARQTLGRVAFDTGLNTFGVVVGAGMGGYLKEPRVSTKLHEGIQDFTKKGFLPPGEHQATWSEFSERFSFTPKRAQQMKGLEETVRDLKELGCKKVYIGGSFVTTKPSPTDIDGVWTTAGTRDAFDARWKWFERYNNQFYKDTETLGRDLKGADFFKYNKRVRQHVGVVSIDLDTVPELPTVAVAGVPAKVDMVPDLVSARRAGGAA